MKIVKISHNRYVKVKNNVSNQLIEDIANIYEIIKQNSDGENTHNHNHIYYTEEEIDAMFKNYSLKNHNHNSSYYTKEESMDIINDLISQNLATDEICISKTPPLNNEKVWFKIL